MTEGDPISPHPASDLNDVVHHRARLGILTVLGEVRMATFPYLKSLLSLTDGNLGRHIEVLAGDGLVSVTKGYENRRPRTWVTITDSGYAALAAEMAVLKQLLSQFEEHDLSGDSQGNRDLVP
jgi:DNA-binding MarR family transcriptional regulator